MKRLRIAVGLVAALCALGALTGSASATTKPKLVFGEFKANLAEGKAPSLAEPGILKLKREAEPELTGLQLQLQVRGGRRTGRRSHGQLRTAL
jgi:hypothetical protein